MNASWSGKWKKTMMTGLAAVMICMGALGGGGPAAADGPAVTLNASTGALNFTYGTVTLAKGSGTALTGIRHRTLGGGSGLWNDTAVSASTVKKGHTTYGQTWGSGQTLAELETTVATKYDGTLTISQNADTQTGGISGVQWGLVVPDTYDLILPVLGGIRLTAESPDAAYGFQQFDYPNIWEAQMFIIQGSGGGMLVHGDDDARFFKSLHVKHENGNFYVGVETYAPAPFAQVRKAVSTGWRLKAYTGDWVNGATLYRTWADKKFDLSKLSKLQPAWAKDVQFTVLTDLEDAQTLSALAQEVEPSQTLLVVPGWREDPYDVDFPDYTPKAGIAAKIQAAQALGFKVMLYVNIFGVDPNNPAFASMQPYQVKDPFSLQPVFSEYTAGSSHIKFAQINPASQAWRTLFVGKMVQLVQSLHPDGIHLDQSLLMYNDANGTIDGRNMLQGNIALHRELREQLPSNVALGGESLNEITTRYESFAQRHAYGIFSQTGTWDDGKIDQVVPASSAIFAPYTTIYGHPDHANPLTEDYFIAWHKVVQNRLGAIPMLTRPNYAQVANPSPLMAQLFAEARWYQDNKPQIDFSQWDGNSLFAFKTASGKSAKYERDAFGEKLTAYGAGSTGGDVGVLRYLYGSDSVTLPGRIPGWYLYDSTKLFGLNPDKTYLYDAEPRDQAAFHIDGMPADVAMKSVAVHTNHTVLSLQDLQQPAAVDFLNYAGPIRAGEKLADGTVHQTATSFSSVGGFSYSFAQGGTVQHWGDRILAHPPYSGVWQGGHTWLEFDVTLPADRTPTFETGVQLGSEVNVASSDGVTFKVYAWEKAAPAATRPVLSTQQFSHSATPTPVSLDLSSFKGKEVTIRMETHPGTTVDNDSAVWVAPHVALAQTGAARSVDLTLVSPRQLASVASASGLATYTSLGANRYKITAPATDQVYLIYSAGGAVTLPLSLSAQPFDSNLQFEDGSTAPPQDPFGGKVGTGVVLGVQKQGLDAHPPQHGQTRVDYVVTLPSGGAKLTGFAGIKDGAEDSQGVGFRVAVNGSERWSDDLQPGGAWTPFSVSLSAYAGKTVVVTLITDSLGDYGYDWAFWGEPKLEALP
ncbi:DUF6259 domain-containing protein [Cohnella sp. GCM10012308]|uniref:DUF6259 domain-containing protein n=1 Tax=Cohnella sp. GCM10012308 TaxID=3317329 RepID=UPI00360C7E43